MYQTVLDGTAEAFPSNANSENIGYWSEQISENNGYFNEPIVLTFQSENTYSSKGITLKFDEQNNVFATRIKVEWYGLHDKIIEKNFSPDSPSYFCDCEVEEYNKIIITFYAINMPKNKLKLTGIDYGRGVVFYKNEMIISKPRSTNPYDYIRTGYYIDNAQFFGGKNNVDFNCNIPGTIPSGVPNFSNK